MTSNRAAAQDAIALLTADHKKVKQLFSKFEKLKDSDRGDEKADVVATICNELKVHTAIEEEIFYPAVREAIEDSDLMDEALVEHDGAKDLIIQLEGMTSKDGLYEAKVTVLGEQIDHHVKEEEGVMFPKARKAKVDTAVLGAKMLKRKIALVQELGISEEDDASSKLKAASR